MPILLFAGLALLVLAVVAFSFWFGHLWIIVKALAPLALLAAGAVLSYFGWEEWREKKNPVMDFSTPDEKDRYQAEARAYQEKLNQVKNEKEE